MRGQYDLVAAEPFRSIHRLIGLRNQLSSRLPRGQATDSNAQGQSTHLTEIELFHPPTNTFRKSHRLLTSGL